MRRGIRVTTLALALVVENRAVSAQTPPPPPAGPPPPAVVAPAEDGQHLIEFYGLLIPAVEMTSATGADDTQLRPSNGSSIRWSSFGGPYSNNPANQTPRFRTISAPSNVGVRGRYNVLGTSYARFQWEIGSLTFGGTLPQTMFSPGLTLQSRNSGVFLGGKWGEFGFGVWDTPISMLGNYAPQYAVLTNASTLLSSSIMGGLPFANGAVAGQTNLDYCKKGVEPKDTALGFVEPHLFDLTHCINQATNFDRRQANSLIAQSPNVAGFVLRVQHEVNFRKSNDFIDPPLNPFLLSGSLAFTRGGLFMGVGAELRKDFVAQASQYSNLSLGLGGDQEDPTSKRTVARWSSGPTGIDDSTESGARVNIRYTFDFGLTLGVLAERLNYRAHYKSLQAGDILDLTKMAGRVEAVFVIGPHTIGAAYHQAMQLDGKTHQATFNATESGGWGLTAGYAYQIAKKVYVQVYFMRITNDTNARYNVVFQGLPSAPGADLMAFGTGLRYQF